MINRTLLFIKQTGLRLAISIVILYQLTSMTAQAQEPLTIEVSRFDDPVPRANPRDCLPNDCSLREAIIVTNTPPQSADTIVLNVGSYQLTATETVTKEIQENAAMLGDLDVLDDLTIIGKGINQTIINGLEGDVKSNPKKVDRVFHVLGGNFTLSNVTVQGGAVDGQSETGLGGGILFETDQGILAITDAQISNNQARIGGGVSNQGREAIVNIVRSTLSNNASNNGSGGGFDSSRVQIADVNIISSAIISNSSSANGGGVYFYSDPDAGEKVVMNIINSTISYNQAKDYGGGLANEGNGQVNLQNSTIAYNQSNTDADPQGDGGGGGIAALTDAIINVSHSIIANNSDTRTSDKFAPDCYPEPNAAIVSIGYNLIGKAENCNWSKQDTDTVNRRANLDKSLTSSSQSPPFHALLAGSPAIGSGNSEFGGQLGACTNIDQQGYSRQVASGCDIGAYQSGSTTPILDLNLIKSGPDLIDELGSPISYTLSLINSSLITATNVVITDAIPDQSFYVPGSGGERIGGVIQWSTPQLPDSNLFIARFVVTSNNAVVNNDFRVTADGFASSGFNQVGTLLAEPDFIIQKTASASFVSPGEPITYTITVFNKGGRDATNVVITDALPAGATYVGGGQLIEGNIVRWPNTNEILKIPSAAAGANNNTTVSYVVTAQTTLVNHDYRVTANDGFRVYSATGAISVTTLVGERTYLPIMLK